MSEIIVSEAADCFKSHKEEGRGKEDEERKDSDGLKEYSELLGRGKESEEARDEWTDAVEQLLEYEAFERGEIHSRRNFDQVMVDGDYGLDQPPRWMVRGF